MSYLVGKQGNSAFKKSFKATAGQTQVTFLVDLNPNATSVYKNGVMLYPSDYTLIGNTITFGVALNVDDEIVVESTLAKSVYVPYFDGYYGPLTSDPATRPDGTARQKGDEYFSTSANKRKVWNGTAWEIASADAVTGAALTPAAAWEDVPSSQGAGGLSDVTNQQVQAMLNRFETLRAFDGIKALQGAPRVDRVGIEIKGFYAGSGLGGGIFYWDASRAKSEHNGGTVVAPEALTAWNGSQSTLSTLLDWTGSGAGCFVKEDRKTLAPEEFGVIDGSALDQTAGLLKALKVSSAASKELVNNFTILANIALDNESVFLTGSGTIKPFNRASSAFNLTNAFENTVSVTGLTAVDGGTGRVTQLTVASHNFTVGDVVKVVSEDLIPTVPTSYGLRLGEWATVMATTATTVQLNRQLKETYLTTVRVGAVSKKRCTIHHKFVGTTGNATSNGGLVVLRGLFEPELDISVSENDGQGLALRSCYAAKGSVRAKNLSNRPEIGAYGYGVSDHGCGQCKLTILQTGFCRHAYTTNYNPANTTELWSYGEPWANEISGHGTGCLASTWDTHEMGDEIHFVNVRSDGARGAVQSRAKGTKVTNVTGDNNLYGVQVRNTAANTKAEMTVSGANLTRNGKPILLSDDSNNGNKPTLVVNGHCYLEKTEGLAATPTVAAFGNVTINGQLSIKATGTPDTGMIVEDSGTFDVRGLLYLDSEQSDYTRILRADNAGVIKTTGSGKIVVQHKDAAFPTLLRSDTTGTINADIELVNAMASTRWVGGAGLSAMSKIKAPSGESSSNLYINTSSSTTATIYGDDPLVVISVLTASGAQTLTVSNGKVNGQRIAVVNLATTATLTALGRTIPPQQASEFIWRGAWYYLGGA